MCDTAQGLETDEMDRLPTAPPQPVDTTDNGRVTRPTDEDYRRLKTRIKRAFELLVPIYGLSHWDARFFYCRGPFQDGHKDAAAYVTFRWQYETLTVYFSVNACYDDTWEDVLVKVAHELAHVPSGQLIDHTPGMEDPLVRGAVELLTTRIASSVLRALRTEEVDDPCPDAGPAP